jgi:hypothetical protein
MCWGGGQQVQQPQIIYRGPSDEELQRGQDALDKYAADIAAQNEATNQMIQDQIDEGNAALDDLRASFDARAADVQAAADRRTAEAQASGNAQVAAANATQNAAYTVNTASETLQDAQTTEAIPEKKKDKKANLKISTAGANASPGAGVNLGI